MTKMLNLIKNILWTQGYYVCDEDTFEQLMQHSVEMLVAPYFSQLQLSENLRKTMKNRLLQLVVYNTQCINVQKHLNISVPYVVLKGTTAAQYYPHPEYRVIGDIDIITKKEDFKQAYDELLKDNYTITSELEREVSFEKDGVTVELHRHFASLNDPKQEAYMDELIVDNINSSHVVPDDINGLVLLEHINQHLEKGLGLRQVIDWMMFVDKCLPDDKWQSFQTNVKAIGLDNLAIVITRMCELFLGLPHRKWCNQADDKLCKQLLDYIMSCGNFGIIRSQHIGTGDNVFYFSYTPRSFFHLLQARGEANWRAAQKYIFLKPFAWIYQLFRYTTKGLGREDAPAQLMKEYRSAKQRKSMFKALGVKHSTTD